MRLARYLKDNGLEGLTISKIEEKKEFTIIIFSNGSRIVAGVCVGEISKRWSYVTGIFRLIKN